MGQYYPLNINRYFSVNNIISKISVDWGAKLTILPDITDEQRDKIVDAGLLMIRALTQAYGGDAGSELYIKMEECLGAAAGMAMLRILCGEDLNLRLKWHHMRYKIQVIRAIRESARENGISGTTYPKYRYDLISAKNIADNWQRGGTFDFSCLNENCLATFKSMLSNEDGLTIS